MAVFRIEKTRDYTVMSNHHLRNAGLSLKSKGLLSMMSDERIQKIIESMRDKSYLPKPARREYIAKKNSNKKRPLGIQSGNDKLVQEVVKMILESIYEPVFKKTSHGFRPNKSCQTALYQIQKTFTGTNWFVEGDIHACFDSFNHHTIIRLLRKRIDDEMFLQLIWKFVKAGYMEQDRQICQSYEVQYRLRDKRTDSSAEVVTVS